MHGTESRERGSNAPICHSGIPVVVSFGMGAPLHIFVSWSGDRSRMLARALCAWLRDIFDTAVEPWMSDETEAGAFWNGVA